MTTIELFANDEVLDVVKTPTISSGNENSVELLVTFSAEWTDLAKTAIFFNDFNDKKIFKEILVGGKCTIPKEVLKSSNPLYIGVRGINADKKVVKTTTMIKYKIEKGAPKCVIDNIVVTPDHFEQLLTAYGKLDTGLQTEATERKSEIEVERNRITELTKTGTLKTEVLLYTGQLNDTTVPVEFNLSEPVTNFEYLNIAYKWTGIIETTTVRVEDIKDNKEYFGLRKINLWNAPSPGTVHGGELLEASMEIKKDSNNQIVVCNYLITEGVEIKPTPTIIPLISEMENQRVSSEERTIAFYGVKTIKEPELADIRVGADGTKYLSAGESVRAQISKLKENISVIDTNKISKPTWEQNGKIPRALNGEIEWTALGLPTAEQTNAAVTDWLNKHPEATTTVENGSLTELKIQSDFLKKIKNDYITPEMFGAKGDGTTDDTIAIQKSVDYAVKNKIKLCMSKKYKTTETITLRGVSYIIDAKSSSIIYSGTGCAIKITKSSDCLIDFGRIDALNGDCVEMYSTSTSDYVQYINLSFICFRAKNNCIKLNPVGGWVTEIRISDGMFNSGNYGIYADCYGADRCNGIKILKVGIEGVKTGFYMANGVQCWDIIAPRFSENYNRVFETVGEVTHVNFIGSSLYYFEKDIFSDKTYKFKINAPCTIIGGTVIANEGVVNGIPLIKTEHGYLNISPKKSVEEIYDIGAIKEYIRRVPAFIYCSNVKKIKLSKEMGRIYGMNEFFLNFYNETATPFEVISSDGAIIYKEVITYKWLKFKWFNEIGWKCFEVNICNM